MKPDEALVAVAEDPRLEAVLMELLKAADAPGPAPPPDAAARDALEVRHHAKWTAARAAHVAANREAVEHRAQSLAASHHARRAALGNKIALADDENIRRMREGELARAEADFARRLKQLKEAANAGDVRASAVVFGTITVRG